MNKNTIYFERKNKVVVEAGTDNLSNNYVATAAKNIELLGFTFSPTLIERVRTLSLPDFTALYNQLVKDIKYVLGAYVVHRPLFPNFPNSVMLTEEAELYVQTMMQFVPGTPVQEAEERWPIFDDVNLKVIDLGSYEDFDKMISNLIAAKIAISPTDKDFVDQAIESYEDLSTILPDEIPNKENLAFTVGSLLKHDKAQLKNIAKYFKTATDVLRLAVALSGGDVSLATNTKFKRFKRAERRLILSLLEQSGNITEDMLRYKNRWIRLGHGLHVGEFKQFSKANEAFDILRNNKEFETFAGKVELSLQAGDIAKTANLLKNRPGEFARRLDAMLRKAPNPMTIVEQFGEVADQVATPVLLQLQAHFKHRNETSDLRTFFPKGVIAHVKAIPNTLNYMDNAVCLAVVEKCQAALMKKFAELETLGKVYVDDKLSQYLVPFSQRSASKALRTIVRGSRVKLPEGNTVRFFTYWKEGKVGEQHTGTVDIDLSAIVYDANWNFKQQVSFTNYRDIGMVHSGDVRTAPHGASEFIDVDIDKVAAQDGRYVVMSLYSFSNQPYSALPECFAGWMMRQFPKSGEIYEPASVIDKVDIAADTQVCIPVIIDLVEREVVWTDLAFQNQPNTSNTVESTHGGLALIGKAMTELKKPNLYDLFLLHALSRGEIVDNVEEAETVFSIDKGITPYDIEKVMAEFI